MNIGDTLSISEPDGTFNTLARIKSTSSNEHGYPFMILEYGSISGSGEIREIELYRPSYDGICWHVKGYTVQRRGLVP